jgi:hypothetical protein
MDRERERGRGIIQKKQKDPFHKIIVIVSNESDNNNNNNVSIVLHLKIKQYKCTSIGIASSLIMQNKKLDQTSEHSKQKFKQEKVLFFIYKQSTPANLTIKIKIFQNSICILKISFSNKFTIK